MDRQHGCLEPGLIEVLVPVRHVEGARRKKLASGINGPTQGPCKREHSKKGTRPDIMTSTSTEVSVKEKRNDKIKLTTAGTQATPLFK